MDNDLITKELQILDIDRTSSPIKSRVGDETLIFNSVSECKDAIKHSTVELKEHLWSDWNDVVNLSRIIIESDTQNAGQADNIIFLHQVKTIFALSRVFSELSEISKNLYQLFNIDIINVHRNLITKFNMLCLRIKMLHYLIMREKYRLQLLSRYDIRKTAQVSGPWANLDLPMAERVWEWDSEDDYLENRDRARKEQIRYNPETTKQGYYFVWDDPSRDPYLFEDMATESPYRSRSILTIASR